MPLKVLRVSLHPWLWWKIVKPALVGFTQGELTVDNRRRMAVILSALEDGLDHDDVVLESPYARLSEHETKAREQRNAEIVLDCERASRGEDPRYVPDRAGFDGRVIPGFRPLPRPTLRVALSFPREDLRVVENAVEAHARRPDVDRSYDRALVDVLDAIRDAKEVEVLPAG